MSSGYTLELMRWGGDGEVHLYFEDFEGSVGSMNFVVKADGKAYREETVFASEDDEEGVTTLTEVNLPLELLALNIKLYGEGK